MPVSPTMSARRESQAFVVDKRMALRAGKTFSSIAAFVVLASLLDCVKNL